MKTIKNLVLLILTTTSVAQANTGGSDVGSAKISNKAKCHMFVVLNRKQIKLIKEAARAETNYEQSYSMLDPIGSDPALQMMLRTEQARQDFKEAEQRYMNAVIHVPDQQFDQFTEEFVKDEPLLADSLAESKKCMEE